MKTLIPVLAAAILMTSGISRAQKWPATVVGTKPQSALTFDEMVDRAITRESALLNYLHDARPVVETYIQDLETDADFGTAPKSDHYYLGKLDISSGVNEKSFIPKAGWNPASLLFFNKIFSPAYLPQGFAQMILMDGMNFNRDHYSFEFLRREFLGDVRTFVVTVRPLDKKAKGLFIGSVWIEDRDFNIVRFNGTYSGGSSGKMYAHFDSWRVNTGPGLWLPAQVYSEEEGLSDALKMHKLHFKAMTRLWGYATPAERSRAEFTSMRVEMAGTEVQDHSPDAADNSPLESRRAWAREAENNVIARMEKAGMLASPGGLDKVLDTVVNNLIATNQLNIAPEVRTRALLTTPLESFTVGHTIVISRGLLDTLPDEASLAAILAHELAHIALGHETSNEFAFGDRTLFDDEQTIRNFRLERPQNEEDAANAEAVRLLLNSPYKDQLGRAGLFLKALGNEANRLPALIKPLFGSRMTASGKTAGESNVLRMSALLEKAPQLQATRTDQVAALPLGSRTKLDPWTNSLEMLRTRAQAPLSAREKMPFELTPVVLRLTWQTGAPVAAGAKTSGEPPETGPAGSPPK